MLQIKNTLGGGGGNAPYAWAKYEAEYCSFESINRTESGKATITSTNLDLDNMTESDFRGFKGKIISDSTSQTFDAYFSYDNEVLKFNYSNVSTTATYNSTTHTLSFGINLSHVFDFVGFEFTKKTFIEYATDKSPTKYPNGEVHTDGFFYRYAPEGLYAWKKGEIGSELKEINESVSILPYDFYYGSAVVLNGEIHILGGYVSYAHTNHYKWDGSSWTSVSTLPYDFYCGSAVVLNNEIHILGGTGNSLVHYKFDGATWTSVSTLPFNFTYGSAVVLNGEIHILGSSNSSYRQRHYKWNGTSWESIGSMPFSLYNGSAVVLNNEIHAFCGSGGSTLHYKWDGSSWTSVSTLPFNFTYGCAVIFENNIHVLGTYFGSNYKIHYKWDGTSWTSVSTLPYDFYRSSAVVYNNEIHILGSESSSYYTAHYSVYGYVPTYTFLNYIVSDKETAYPDGGEKGGYWYERVIEGIDFSSLGITKYEIGSFTPASNVNTYTINHSLGIIPKYLMLKVEKKTNNTNNDIMGLVINNSVKLYTSYYNKYGNSGWGEGAETATDTTLGLPYANNIGYLSGVTYNYIILG